uniref:Uncharacterized protein n=1 Tax=Parascaris equorum TaxID=6256 RepID=A0A914RRG9_PAREQ
MRKHWDEKINIIEPKNIFSPRCDTTIVDPLSATIGVGLGLPGYSPGAADRNLMRDALLRSEVHEIEEAMLKDKINMTDYERTEQEISEQVSILFAYITNLALLFDELCN